jgi:hypothetical protein
MSGHSTGTIYDNLYANNAVSNIIGDDAEGWYAIGGAGIAHKGSFTFMNNTFSNCTRRATKACVSNVAMYDNTFTELEDALFFSAQQVGSMVDFFSTTAGSNIFNLRLIRNILNTPTGQDIHYHQLSFTNAEGIIVKGNTISSNNPNNYGNIRLGSNTSTYTGLLVDVTITGNTINNGYFQVMANYIATVGSPLQINNNTITWTSGNSFNSAAFYFLESGSGDKGYIDFDNNNITYPSLGASVDGLINSPSASINIVGFNADGNTINFTGTDPTYEIGYVVGSMTSSSITNTTITNGSGTPILRVDGTTGVTNTGNSPIVTIQ